MLYEQFDELWQVAHKRHVSFFYAGYFSQPVVAAVSETIRARLDSASAAGPTSRRIFSAFVEMAQNLMHYSSEALTPADQRDRQMRRGSFASAPAATSPSCCAPTRSSAIRRWRSGRGSSRCAR